ncbi:MAG: ATP-binding cassette domain-containing protein [Candidatus Aenigmarchaeota archaeon]|nr:ATP-binding cassette domain-containing protein [Candidatus Aenigmarchaeota archaeon]
MLHMIEVRDLSKVFNGRIKAVDGIDVEVRSGEIFGLLGPNGAGKTTTIRMLATMTKPTSGQAMVCGIDVAKDPDSVRRCIGIVFQDPALDDQLTGGENLDFHARMYGMPRKEREERINEVLRLVELSDRADELVEKYSGGMKRRLEIARGLMHRPKVLFLDEPTLGLDAQTRRIIWDHIMKLNSAYNITVILTTHYMEEADFLCKRVAIIDHGKILAIDTPENMKRSLGGDLITLKVKDAAKTASIVRSIKGVKQVKRHDNSVSIAMANAGSRIPELLKKAESAGIEVESIDLHKPTLEDVFIHFTGKRIRDQEANAGDRLRERMRARNRR